MAFHIVRNDIVKMHVDAIVNSANPKPTFAYGTDLAIYTAAGPDKILSERKKIGDIAPGQVAATSAGKLKAKYILHTVGPSWDEGGPEEFEILKACYANTLRMARQLHCKSIAFPLIATGIYGFPKDKALEIAMSEIQKFLIHYQMDVFLVVFDEKSFVLSGQIFDEIQAYVDANYISDARQMEYGEITASNLEDKLSDDQKLRDQALHELESNIKELNRREMQDQWQIGAQKGSAGQNPDFSDADLEAMLISDEKTFQEKLFEYIDRSGLKPSAIYRPIEMSRQNYSRMQCNRNYQPKKNTALLLCIVLHLDLAETEDLLSRAGLALNPSNKQDVIVKACILRKQYDFFVIDGMLQKNHLDSLIDYDGK